MKYINKTGGKQWVNRHIITFCHGYSTQARKMEPCGCWRGSYPFRLKPVGKAELQTKNRISALWRGVEVNRRALRITDLPKQWTGAERKTPTAGETCLSTGLLDIMGKGP